VKQARKVMPTTITAKMAAIKGLLTTAGTQATGGIKAITGLPTHYGRQQKQGCLQKS
jgi:hypothetical protein